MFDAFAQPIKMMERTTAMWQDMVSSSPWFKKQDCSFAEMWNPWLASVRSTNDLNTSASRILLEHSEEVFFKMLKESKLYSQVVESQIRENWEAVKKTQNAQREAIEGFLGKIESFLVKTEEQA
jgi:hypothetical protein